jgi:hypothetical protein
MNTDLLRRRRSGPRKRRGSEADQRAGQSERGGVLVVHFLRHPASDLDDLALDLDPRRRHVSMLEDLSGDELAERLRRHAACLPDDLLLNVRFSAKYPCPVSPAALAALRPRVQSGSPERDIGRFPLIQIADIAAPGNRVRIGRLTALVRAALASARVARQFSAQEVS